MVGGRKKPALIFMWEQFAPYHVDRLEALADRLGEDFDIVGIEVASKSLTYAWPHARSSGRFERHLLFPGANAEEIPWRRKLVRSLGVVRRYRAAGVFMCNQEHPEILAMLFLLKLRGVPCYAMMDVKFDDRQRSVWQEVLKTLVFRTYAGGLVGAERHVSYFRFLGLPGRWISPGYLTVSIDRVRREAATVLAPDGVRHAERHFVVVGRFVERKDIATVIRAYVRFRASHPGTDRRLLLCGSGPTEEELRRIAPDGVDFLGFLDSAAVSRVLARSLVLVLPSRTEQWGLVVNEAIALNIPVLCTDNVGARDQLVRSGVNGFIFEPGNDEGLARLMGLLADDEAMWREFSVACRRFAGDADVGSFIEGVRRLVAPRRTAREIADKAPRGVAAAE